MPTYTSAGADAAGQYDDYFRQIIQNDPDIQRVIQGVWGSTPVDQRPSDTPKHLEQANHRASQQIAQMLQQKGIALPDRTFVNPRSGALEGHRGWSGLSGLQKAAIIAAASAAGVGGLAAMGALGGGAAGAGGAASGAGAAGGGAGTIGGLGAGLGVTSGLPAGMAGVGATGIGAGGAALGGSSPWISAVTNAGRSAAMTKAQGGSWKDALLSGATGAGTGGLGIGGAGGSMNWMDLLKNPNTWGALAQVAGQAAGGKSDQRMQESAATNQANLADLALYTAAQNAQNQAGQLDLNRKGFSEQARGGRAKQALLADLLSNIKDVNINVPGVQTASVSGGLRPSAIGGTGRGSLAELAKQALQAQLQGDTFTGGEILPTPQYRAMPQQGGLEKTLDWISLFGSGAGALGGLLGTQQPTTYSQLPGQTGVRPQGLR